MRIRSATAAAFFTLAAAARIDAAEPVDYLRGVKPVLANHCYSCHGALQQKSKLRLDTVALMKKGGSSGPAIVPGESGKSLLVEHITSKSANRMPPPSEGEPLKPAEIAMIRQWIDQGAQGPADEQPEADPKDHWAFRPPVKPKIPTSEFRNPIDAFLEAERVKHGLKPQPPADKRILLRRVYLDLVGLPPTHAEQEAFLADNSPDAFEKVVDRLLASKQYGERWGRHWMDVWRYSDWWGLGAEVRNSQKHIWHWRDWIIESLNVDKGYDQMVREMLAADELHPTDRDRIRATGFLARQYFIFNRNTWLEEVVEHTSKAFLGLTMNCAKCHDHKYDPIEQRDFYRFRAFFEPYQVRADMVPGETDFSKNGIPRVFDCNLEAPTYLFVRGDEKNPRKDEAIPPGLPSILSPTPLAIKPVALPLDAHTPGLREDVIANYLAAADKQAAAAESSLQQARQALAEAMKKATTDDPKQEPAPSARNVLAADDFRKENGERWEVRSGKWTYRNDRLIQSGIGAERGVLRLKQAHPADFEARLVFKPTGGVMWKSVGITFDVDGDSEALVYLSAVNGGAKLQVAYKQNGNYVYPADAAQARPVNLNEVQDLLIRVRGPLVQVSVNGKTALAYRLPVPRKPGAMEIITYDASAEFSRFELATLPTDVKLDGAAEAGPASVEELQLQAAIAERALAVARAQRDAVKARAAADRARLAQPPAADAKELARAAYLAESSAAVAAADEGEARAQLELRRTAGPKKAEAEKKLAAARQAAAKARKELDAPGDNYTPLRGSLKTPESNLESEASRNKPYPTTSTGRRSALANWIADAKNPLTARVAVNHLWARHFGRPLVPTVFEFGRKGSPPTHPELLDFLAVELAENRWSMKHLHRLIVTSKAYRMMSSSAAAASSVDPENRYYWRMNPIRMEAQLVRDSLLHLAGELDLTMGGPPIPAQDEASRRRSLYFFHSHNEHNKFLSLFDDANVLECYRRSESIVPQQALALENSKLTLASAEKIARQIEAKDDAAFVKTAFETILGSSPTREEQAECEGALGEFREIALKEKKGDATSRARANLIHALLNHNDFVTIR